MVNKELLKKIQLKHPEYSLDNIRIVINKHWKVFNLKLRTAQTIDLTINKLGTIHTNRNIIRKSKVKAMQWQIRKHKILALYCDRNLLF